MTLHDVSRLFSYWRREPPLRVLFRAFAEAAGVKIEGVDAAEKPQHMDAAAAKQFIAITGGRIDGVGSM